MPQKSPCPRQNPLAQTVYPLQGGKMRPSFENKKKFGKKIFMLHYHQKNYAESIDEIRF